MLPEASTQVELLKDFPEPYVEMVTKMMIAFESFGLWNMIKGEEKGDGRR